ncbi:cation transporting ATPase C-terminal domain-containing protein [Kitasatospora sp. NPDC001159]
MPFLFFALGGGRIPLPLTILQLLAFDVGSETLPALALSREPAEPGLMDRPPRPRSEGVIRGPMLLRAWLFLGAIVAALQMTGFFYVLTRADWTLGDPTGPGQPLHHAYQQATTMTFLGMIAGQIGTAFAVRTSRSSLRSVGVLSNRYLLAAIAGELLLAAVFVYTPPFQKLLGTAALPASDLLFLLPSPFIVWGADELRRYLIRRHNSRPPNGNGLDTARPGIARTSSDRRTCEGLTGRARKGSVPTRAPGRTTISADTRAGRMLRVGLGRPRRRMSRTGSTIEGGGPHPACGAGPLE